MQKLWYNIFNLLRDHVIKRHVTQSLHTISSFPPNLVYMSFFKLWHRYYKVWEKFITKCSNYYKVRRNDYKQQTSLLIKFNKVSYIFCQLRKFNCVTLTTKTLKLFLISMFNLPFLAICSSQFSLLISLISKSENCAANELEK